MVQKTSRLTLILCCFLMASACAGRMPTQKRSERAIHHFFQRYAKKYPTTSFGMHGIKGVEIIDQQEIRKHLIAVQAYITLKNGDLRKISATLEKKSLGWKFISWENPEGS
ncbi:MAG: hypothetical protein HY540_01290 [Deltaproteobacteria bacterium]|nr:hypothetical protein [Deltaproteobacteria bacterium]